MSVLPAVDLSVPLLQVLDSRTRQDPFLSHQEGHFKVQVMAALLSLGYSLQEGAPRAGLAHFATPAPGSPAIPTWRMSERLVRVEGGSSDVVAMLDGRYRQFELKTRCDHGTKSGASTAEIASDFRRVGRASEFTFIGVFDGDIYRSFSGDKVERRGRKAALPALTSVFPPMDRLFHGQVKECAFEFEETDFAARLIRQDLSSTFSRVLVTVDRA